METIAEIKRKASLLQGGPVAVLRGDEAPFQGFGELRKWATGLFQQQGGRARHPEIGDVLLDERAVRDSTAHGMSPYKAVAFVAVKEVIERGALVLQSTHGNTDSFYLAAPVRIGEIDNIASVLVHRTPDVQRLYLHSVRTKEGLLGAACTATHHTKAASGYTGTQSGTDAAFASVKSVTGGGDGKADPRDVNTILSRLLQVNLES